MSKNLKTRVIKGAAWYVGMRWALRLIGLVSVMILARLLTPEDFGTVAAILALLAVVEAFFEFGFDTALIKDQRATRQDFDTAWTLRLIKLAVVAVLLLIAAPFVGAYAGIENMPEIAAVVAASIAIRGFTNIGVVQFQKDLEISRVFLSKVLPKILGAITVVALALVLRDYWALVFGQLATAIYSVAVSYLVSPFRPRLSLARTGHIWAFSKWLFLRNLSRQLMLQSDKVMLSGQISRGELGQFTVAASLAHMLTAELAGSAGQAIMPGMAKLQGQPEKLRHGMLLSISVLTALVLPVGVLVSAASVELTEILLGHQWIAAASLVSFFAVRSVALNLAQNLSDTAAMVGLNRATGILTALLLAMYLIGFFPIFGGFGLQGIIVWTTLLALVEIPVLLGLISRTLEVRAAEIVRALWRPACATALMALALAGLPQIEGAALSLAAKAVAGATVYTGATLLLWLSSGRGSGLERTLVDLLSSRLASQRARNGK